MYVLYIYYICYSYSISVQSTLYTMQTSLWGGNIMTHRTRITRLMQIFIHNLSFISIKLIIQLFYDAVYCIYGLV